MECNTPYFSFSFVFRVARLQNEVGTKCCFVELRMFYEDRSDILPKIVEPLFLWVRELPQTSHHISREIPAKIKKVSPTSFCRLAGELFCAMRLVQKICY